MSQSSSLGSSGQYSWNTTADLAEETSEPSCLQRHNVRIIGSGSTLLFLSHGFGTNQQVWEGVLGCLDLKTQYRVILWDIMGAYSTNPENYDFQRYSSLYAHADDLLEVLQELDVESIIYVGHSVGGMIGLLASIEAPQLFKKLILLGASVKYLNDHASGYVGGFEVNDLDQLFAAMQSNYTTWVSGFSSFAVGDSIDAPSVREFSRTLFLIRPDIAFSTLKMIFQTDFRDVLSKVTPRVHLLQTEQDGAVPLQATQFLAKNLPDSMIEILPLSGHLPHLAHPTMVAEVIAKHIHLM